ncbi:MAG TPA: IS1595 family transposase [Acidimicrobiales bacterium]|nr:IS1595 family transposase [Acidimicrobiales bacterium]
MSKTTIASLSRDIQTEAQAYEYLERLRWDGRPACAHCGSENVYYIAPIDGSASRKTRTGALSERRVWRCRGCNKQFSVLTGTVMHGTKVSVRTWVMVWFEMCASKNGVAAREVERKYGLCPRTAWHLLHRIRTAMGNDDGAALSGIVEADEMYIGKHHKGRGSGPKDKVPVVTVVERGGRARSVVARTNVEAPMIVVDSVTPDTTVYTDESRLYFDLDAYVAKHGTVNHSKKQWRRGEACTNTVEGFFGQVRRSLSGTHHRVTNKHAQRYLSEFDCRYSTRGDTDADRMAMVLRQMDGPLPYRSLIGR